METGKNSDQSNSNETVRLRANLGKRVWASFIFEISKFRFYYVESEFFHMKVRRSESTVFDLIAVT
jgi:hypothetical protein